MKILFLAQHKWPHVGGVETHMRELTKNLERKGNSVTTISSEDIKYPKIKFLGLLYIWCWLWKHRNLINTNELIHCHDVFIWYLPFRLMYPNKPVFTTFHGWEGVYPIPWKNILYKRLANKLSWGSIAVGKYIEKYYGIKAYKIIHGGANATVIRSTVAKRKKDKGNLVFVGRLENDTGVLEFLKWLKTKQKFKVDFVGDGSIRSECEKYGSVHGFVDPKPFLRKAEYCVPGGYLSFIEASSYGCKIKVFPNNPLKNDYWNEIQKVSKFPTWEQIADEYINLYNGI